MQSKKLPIGVQTFLKMREGDYLYIDKTEWVHKIADNGGAFFLSRPRRFGKSLFLSTIFELVTGNRALFEGTWIADKWDWTRRNPVLYFKFASMGFKDIGLNDAILLTLKDYCAEYDITPKHEKIHLLFKQLLQELSEKHGKVVLLIDEYDKPIIEYMETHKLPQAKENQDIMKNFYGTLKDAEPYLHLTFITGVSKFARVSLFSDLNHLRDLTLSGEFATAFGHTQTEMEQYFAGHIADFLAENSNYTHESFLQKVKIWYNGYSWDGKTSVYNPFGLATFFQEKAFRNYWFTSGTPTFLLKIIFNQAIFDCEYIETEPLFLEQYSLDNIEFVSLLFQTGYLTIKEMRDDGTMILSYPNLEVRESMYRFILTEFKHKGSGGVTMLHLNKAFRENDMDTAFYLLQTVFNTLPYDVYAASSEALYHGLIHILFNYMGLNIESEVHTKRGRADAVVQTDTHIFIFEFKFNKSPEAAMAQLKNRDYAAKFRASGKKIIGIGLNFSDVNRALDEWLVEEL
jgi:hypothetical protein